MTQIEPYDPFGSRGEWTPATETQCEQMTEAESKRYQRLKDSYDACARADKYLANCERELHATVASAREIEGKLTTLPKLTQHDLVMQMRAVNR